MQPGSLWIHDMNVRYEIDMRSTDIRLCMVVSPARRSARCAFLSPTPLRYTLTGSHFFLNRAYWLEDIMCSTETGGIPALRIYSAMPMMIQSSWLRDVTTRSALEGPDDMSDEMRLRNFINSLVVNPVRALTATSYCLSVIHEHTAGGF